jgi:hypothetical protein
MTLAGVGDDQSLSVAEPSPTDAILRRMKVEEIAEVVAKLPPDQLARFRRWFTTFEAGRPHGRIPAGHFIGADQRTKADNCGS